MNAFVLTNIPSPNIDDHNREFPNLPTSLVSSSEPQPPPPSTSALHAESIPPTLRLLCRYEFHPPETPISPQAVNPFPYAPPYQQQFFQGTSSSSRTRILPSELCLRHQHRVAAMKLNPNQFADAKVNLPKYLFLLSIHSLHLINRLPKGLLHPLRHCPPNLNSSCLRHQQCVAALTRMVIPSLPNPFAKAKVNLPKCLFLLQIHTHNTFHHTNRRGSLLKQLFILHHLIHCHRLNNQESTEVP